MFEYCRNVLQFKKQADILSCFIKAPFYNTRCKINILVCTNWYRSLAHGMVKGIELFVTNQIQAGKTRPKLERRKTLGHLRSVNRNMIIIHFTN